MENRARYVLLLIVLTLIFSSCLGSRKALLTDFPDYFDLPAGSEVETQRDYGRGPEPVKIKTLQDMGCYSAVAQADALALKKGR